MMTRRESFGRYLPRYLLIQFQRFCLRVMHRFGRLQPQSASGGKRRPKDWHTTHEFTDVQGYEFDEGDESERPASAFFPPSKSAVLKFTAVTGTLAVLLMLCLQFTPIVSAPATATDGKGSTVVKPTDADDEVEPAALAEADSAEHLVAAYEPPNDFAAEPYPQLAASEAPDSVEGPAAFPETVPEPVEAPLDAGSFPPVDTALPTDETQSEPAKRWEPVFDHGDRRSDDSQVIDPAFSEPEQPVPPPADIALDESDTRERDSESAQIKRWEPVFNNIDRESNDSLDTEPKTSEPVVSEPVITEPVISEPEQPNAQPVDFAGDDSDAPYSEPEVLDATVPDRAESDNPAWRDETEFDTTAPEFPQPKAPDETHPDVSQPKDSAPDSTAPDDSIPDFPAFDLSVPEVPESDSPAVDPPAVEFPAISESPVVDNPAADDSVIQVPVPDGFEVDGQKLNTDALIEELETNGENVDSDDAPPNGTRIENEFPANGEFNPASSDGIDNDSSVPPNEVADDTPGQRSDANRMEFDLGVRDSTTPLDAEPEPRIADPIEETQFDLPQPDLPQPDLEVRIDRPAPNANDESVPQDDPAEFDVSSQENVDPERSRTDDVTETADDNWDATDIERTRSEFDSPNDRSTPLEDQPADWELKSPLPSPAVEDADASDRPRRKGLQISIEKKLPETSRVRDVFSYEIWLKNDGEQTVDRLIVEEQIPERLRVVSVFPKATYQDRKLRWQLDRLAPKAERRLKIKLVAQAGGVFDSVTLVRPEVAVAAGTQIEAARLKLELRMAGEISPGEICPIVYYVANTGAVPAENVLLYTQLPAALTHPKGHHLEFDVGTLHPGQRRAVRLNARARKSGTVSPRAELTAQGGLRVHATGITKHRGRRRANRNSSVGVAPWVDYPRTR